MQTPIYDFVTSYIDRDSARLHMPGHKGYLPLSNPLNAVAPFDITEIDGADELFSSNGIIAQSEAITAQLYQAEHTCFSTQGSTPCIMAMLRLVAGDGDTIISVRNVHHAFINGCALIGINPTFIYPQNAYDSYISASITKEQVADAIIATPKAKAVYITSPDYLGCMSDITGISEVCKQHGIPLVVDNAHGAYLPANLHPINNGASLCCDSAHKTLPVLTGGAYLHTAKHTSYTKEQVKLAMGLFSSTSPSYLTLISLDLNNRYINDALPSDYKTLEKNMQPIFAKAYSLGFAKLSDRTEIAKLTLTPQSIGYNTAELVQHLQKHNIEPEYCSDQVIVLMFSPNNKRDDFAKVHSFLETIIPKQPINTEELPLVLPKRAVTIRKAVFSQTETISIDQAIGRIAAESKLKCPPGVPIIIPGEIIDGYIQKFLKKSSIFKLSVIK